MSCFCGVKLRQIWHLANDVLINIDGIRVDVVTSVIEWKKSVEVLACLNKKHACMLNTTVEIISTHQL